MRHVTHLRFELPVLGFNFYRYRENEFAQAKEFRSIYVSGLFDIDVLTRNLVVSNVVQQKRHPFAHVREHV